MDDDKIQQVSRQCSAVRHLALNIAFLYADLARIFAQGGFPKIADMNGERSAALMELLGDILNEADAVEESDDWMGSIYDEAHRRWPTHGCPHCGHEP